MFRALWTAAAGRPRRRCFARRQPRTRARVALLAACLLAGCAEAERGAALSEQERQAIAAAVEQRLRDATDLRAGGDVVARLLSVYPDSGRVVSSSAGAITASRDSLGAIVAGFWQNVGQYMQSPEWRWGTMHVDVLGHDAAAVTASYRIPHMTPRGAPHVLGGVWTAVFVRRGGEWVIVQEHLSDVPAAASLTPP